MTLNCTQIYSHSLGDGTPDIVWLVPLAQELASRNDNVEGVLDLSEDVIRSLVERTSAIDGIDESAVNAADPAVPGLACWLYNQESNECNCILIDGHHRAARALRDGVPFRALVLDPRAAFWACLTPDLDIVRKTLPCGFSEADFERLTDQTPHELLLLRNMLVAMTRGQRP